jgi:hypothetical protein
MDDKVIAAAQIISKKLFSGVTVIVDKAGNEYEVKSFLDGKVKCVDVSGYRFITQNPEKDSEYAHLARRGVQVSWVIKLETNEWLARIINDKVCLLNRETSDL